VTAPRIGVVTFPGSLDDTDALRAVRVAGGDPVRLWHADHDLREVAAIVLPGGFSYGDYLRGGAIARFAPVMSEVVEAVGKGMPVLGICNGFQVLCEAHLLPGVLTRNQDQRFHCRDQWLKVVDNSSVWTGRYERGAEILIPVKNGEGRYIADKDTLDRLFDEGQVAFTYSGENPSGAGRAIAGIRNATGTVLGLMPHPEHAIDALTGPSDDGLGVFLSALDALVAAA
jgi:phosphoribosylformylglycinamidine synthase